MTTGPSTRRALAAARAPAAASRGVIHLAAPPERTPRSLGHLAHELSHAADQDRRPRMFGEGLIDSAERRARGVGEAVESTARRGVGRAERTAGGAVRGLLERPPISSLPIGGPAAAVPAAVRAAEGVVSDAGLMAAGAGEAASGLIDRGEATADRFIGEGAGAAERGLAGAEGFARGVAGTAEREAGALGRRAERAVGEARSAIGAAAGQAAGALVEGGQVDAMIEAIEQRLLAEMERRGGRFQGLF
jgi:hypothetical protein